MVTELRVSFEVEVLTLTVKYCCPMWLPPWPWARSSSSGLVMRRQPSSTLRVRRSASGSALEDPVNAAVVVKLGASGRTCQTSGPASWEAVGIGVP